MIDRRVARYGGFLVALLMAGVAMAQDTPAADDQAVEKTEVPAVPATPARAARLTFLAGAVQIDRADNTGGDPAVLNMPLTAGTRIACGDYGQAEIEFEDGSVVRLTPRSVLTLDTLALDTGGKSPVAHTEITLLDGVGYFELRKSDVGTFVVQAGGARIVPVENLTLRVRLDEPPASFAVLTGAARIERADAFSTKVSGGESLRLDAKDDTRYFLTAEVAQESWDSWNLSRDQVAADQAARRTAARDGFAGQQGYGWSDLDANGKWYDVPGKVAEGEDSGPVWQPDNADEQFDPYGYGNWVYVNAGYVWASGYPWGWTPFRCGHWEYYPGFGWGWQPNRLCASFGFDAGGEFVDEGGIRIRGKLPPRYIRIVHPHPRPERPVRVIAVHGPDGMRPAVPHGGPVKIAGVAATALPAIGTDAPRGTNALASDFPVDRQTHAAIMGVAPRSRSDRAGSELSETGTNGAVSDRHGGSVGSSTGAGRRSGDGNGRGNGGGTGSGSNAAGTTQRHSSTSSTSSSHSPPSSSAPASAPATHSSPPASSSSSSSHSDSSSKPK